MNIAQELAKYASIMEQKGYVNSLEGNLSIIDRETGLTYITPSGRMKLGMDAEQICVLNEAGEQVGGSGKRSSEFFLHEAVYKARPDVNAVIHSHCPYLTAYALRYEDFIPGSDCFLGQLFPKMTCLPYGEHGTHDIHKGIEDALEGRPVALLGGHGVVCVGEDLEDAIGILEAAENYAKTIYIRDHMK